MVFPIAGGNESKGYEISNSLRFNDDDSASLTKTFSGDGNRRTFTWSGWVKKGNNGINEILFAAADTDNTPQTIFNFDSADRLSFFDSTSSAEVNTSNLFRDSSAWYHIVLAVDTTQSTNSNRVKIYVNGVEVSYNSTSYPNQNVEFSINDASYEHEIGGRPANTIYFDGYMTEINFIDGSAKAQTDFGEFDDNGVWIPKKYTGTYGTNGFFLQFKQTGTSQNSSGIGADTSGNDNHFAVSNLAATDVTEDTCTNNFATFNPLARNSGNTYTEGNTVYDYSNNYQKAGIASQVFSSGKWYAEFKANGSEMPHYGIVGDTYHSDGRTVTDTSTNWTYDIKGHTGTIVLQIDGTGTRNIWADGSDTGTDTDFYAGTDDIIMIAFDADTKKIWFGKNGTWSNSGNPATASNPTYTYSGTATEDFTFAVSTQNNSSISANFGNPAFAVSSGNTDGKYGNFEYAPPSGYYALCTKRLAEFG